MAEDAGLELRPLVDFTLAVGRQEEPDVGVAGRETERQVARRGPATPARLARVHDEERIAAVEHDVQDIGGHAIDHFVLQERGIDARVLEIEIADATLDVAVTGEHEVERGVLPGAPRLDDRGSHVGRARPRDRRAAEVASQRRARGAPMRWRDRTASAAGPARQGRHRETADSNEPRRHRRIADRAIETCAAIVGDDDGEDRRLCGLRRSSAEPGSRRAPRAGAANTAATPSARIAVANQRALCRLVTVRPPSARTIRARSRPERERPSRRCLAAAPASAPGEPRRPSP